MACEPYESDIGGLLIETFLMTSEVLIERIDVCTIFLS